MAHSQSSPRKLTVKIQLFVEEFLKDFNGTQAAIRAGYSKKTAMVQAWELLRKPEIASLVAARKAELMAARRLSLDEWVDLVQKMALYDPRAFFDKFGNPTEIPELSGESAMALAQFEVEELFDGQGESRKKIGYCRKVKLLDRTPYILMLGKYLNAFPSTSKALAGPVARDVTPFDPSKLTDHELRELYRMRRKMQGQPDSAPSSAGQESRAVVIVGPESNAEGENKEGGQQ